MKELKRIRLGNFLIGLRVEKLPHSIVIRSLVSRVADTAGVLNRFANTEDMCLFLDFDDKIVPSEIDKILTMYSQEYNMSFHLFRTSEGHHNAISPTLINKIQLDSHMKRLMEFLDYRFCYVYFRDGCNAIRLVPKIIDNTVYREITYLESYNQRVQTLSHKGLNLYLQNLFQTPLNQYMDDSTQHDLIIREYETINW